MSRYQKAAIRLARSTACFFLPFGWIERVCWPRKTNWKKSDWRTTRTRFDGWPNDLITARTLWWLCPSNYNMLQSSVGSPPVNVISSTSDVIISHRASMISCLFLLLLLLVQHLSRRRASSWSIHRLLTQPNNASVHNSSSSSQGEKNRK